MDEKLTKRGCDSIHIFHGSCTFCCCSVSLNFFFFPYQYSPILKNLLIRIDTPTKTQILNIPCHEADVIDRFLILLSKMKISLVRINSVSLQSLIGLYFVKRFPKYIVTATEAEINNAHVTLNCFFGGSSVDMLKVDPLSFIGCFFYCFDFNKDISTEEGKFFFDISLGLGHIYKKYSRDYFYKIGQALFDISVDLKRMIDMGYKVDISPYLEKEYRGKDLGFSFFSAMPARPLEKIFHMLDTKDIKSLMSADIRTRYRIRNTRSLWLNRNPSVWVSDMEVIECELPDVVYSFRENFKLQKRIPASMLISNNGPVYTSLKACSDNNNYQAYSGSNTIKYTDMKINITNVIFKENRIEFEYSFSRNDNQHGIKEEIHGTYPSIPLFASRMEMKSQEVIHLFIESKDGKSRICHHDIFDQAKIIREFKKDMMKISPM